MTSALGEQTWVPFGDRLTAVAAADPERPAVIHVSPAGAEQAMTYAELEAGANRLGWLLERRGVGPGTVVAVALAAKPGFAVAAAGAWKRGATVLPLNAAAPPPERAALLAAAAPLGRVVVVDEADLAAAAGMPADPHPTAVADPGLAMGSGGTSGTPKVTVNDGAAGVALVDGEVRLGGLGEAVGLHAGMTHLVCTPLYHTNGFGHLQMAMGLGDTVVLVSPFDAETVLAAIERFAVTTMVVVPAVLQRLAAAPSIDRRDLSSLRAVLFGGAPAPDWLVRRWIHLIGGEHLYFGYGATELHGKTVLRCDEWEQRPGSCGRPFASELRILDADGREVPTGEAGEVFMRPAGAQRPVFRYSGGATASVTDDGFVSLGDIGFVDADGYLYLLDRRTDLIITGGANVYPAEVEAALSAHPAVADVAVIGLPDERWGRRVHAVVAVTGAGASPDDLDAWCRQRLAAYKVPKTYELVDRVPRTEVGKLQRARLARERGADA